MAEHFSFMLILLLFAAAHGFFLLITHPTPGSRVGFDYDGVLKPTLGTYNLIDVQTTFVEPPENLHRIFTLDNGYAIRYNPIEKNFMLAPIQIDDPTQHFLIVYISINSYVLMHGELCVGRNKMNNYLALVECNDVNNRLVIRMDRKPMPQRSYSFP